MKISLALAAATVLAMGSTATLAQMTAPTDQAPPPTVTTVQPDPAASGSSAPSDATTSATASATEGVTKEGSKYIKDGRPATRAEIASYKKAEKARRE